QHVLRQIADIVDVFGHAAAGMNTSQCLLQPVGTFAAGNTPSTALVLVELHGSQGKLHHADGIIQNHHAAGTEHAARLAYLVEVHANVDFVGQKHGGRGSAGNDRFE